MINLQIKKKKIGVKSVQKREQALNVLNVYNERDKNGKKKKKQVSAIKLNGIGNSINLKIKESESVACNMA